MRKVVFLSVAAVLVASAAFATLGSVVASFAAPANYPIALARANNDAYMFVYCNASPYYIWRINSETGAVQASFPATFGSSTRALAYSFGGAPGGSYLWVAHYSSGNYARTNYSTGSIYSSWAAGHSIYGGAPEATADGGSNPQSMILTYSSPAYVWRHTPTSGSIMSSFPVSPAFSYDVAWDWRNQLVWGYYSGTTVYGRNLSGSTVASFAAPASYPLAATYRGEYLWLGTTTGTHRIWKIHCPAGVGIAPASMGKIKAMYK
jgi:hypothetical protein